jgi:hypothetical protein
LISIIFNFFKAVKTSLEIFNRDKDTTAREKNLIKSNLSKVNLKIIHTNKIKNNLTFKIFILRAKILVEIFQEELKFRHQT